MQTLAKYKKICYHKQADLDDDKKRPHGQAVKTLPSHGRICGSIPHGATKKKTPTIVGVFFLQPLQGTYAANYVCRRSYSRQRILPRGSRLRETANSANDYKQKAFGIYAANEVYRRPSICRKANSAWSYGMITKSFWSPRGKRGLPSSVSLPQSRKTFFTKEHNSSAFLWIIRLTFPKSYYIIEI